MKSNLAIVALLASMILPLTACNQVDPDVELAQRRQARAEAEVEKQYANFEQRGEHFRSLVQKLAGKTS